MRSTSRRTVHGAETRSARATSRGWPSTDTWKSLGWSRAFARLAGRLTRTSRSRMSTWPENVLGGCAPAPAVRTRPAASARDRMDLRGARMVGDLLAQSIPAAAGLSLRRAPPADPGAAGVGGGLHAAVREPMDGVDLGGVAGDQ